MKRKEQISLVVAILLAAVFLYLAVRGVDWREVGHVMTRARLQDLAIGCLWASLAILVRAFRWRILLQVDRELSPGLVFWATAIGYLGNHFLPARLGELMRTAAISWKTGLRKAYVLATALTERMLDAAILVLISSVALLTMSSLPGWSVRSAQIMAVVSSVGVAGIFLLPSFEGLMQKGLDLLPLRPALHARMSGLMTHFLLGMRVFHHSGRALRFLALTGVIWGIDGLAALSVSQALNLGLSFSELLLLIAALGLASALPSTPGFVGVYQFVAVTVLGPFGISRSNALAYIFLFQGVISGCVLAWGLMGLWRLRSSGALTSMRRVPDPAPAA